MFVLSKLLSAATQPLSWVALLLCLGLCLRTRRPVWSPRLMWMGMLCLGSLGFQAIPDALIRQLESRYPVPTGSALAPHVGVIVLGGALEHPRQFLAHDQVPLGDAAERMTVPLTLMRDHPTWTLVFSGGEGRLGHHGVAEAELARAFYNQQGLEPQRVLYESQARNTRENAQQVAHMLGARCQQEHWLLVTSAFHMARSVAEFEAVGCLVTPYPVDFRTGTTTPWYEYSMAHSLFQWQTALHEYLGMWVYGLTRPLPEQLFQQAFSGRCKVFGSAAAEQFAWLRAQRQKAG